MTNKLTRKRSKLSELLRFDNAILSELAENYHLIGMDEVGRGSLIGSVVAGAVCIPRTLSPSQKKVLSALDDSKKLSASVRAELSEAIHAFCLTGIGTAERSEVETLNVYHASLLAIYRAATQLATNAGIGLPEITTTGLHESGQRDQPHLPVADNAFLLLDGKALIPYFRRDRQRAIIKGDGCSAAIAAASVIAKHHRDTEIISLAKAYPGYGWEKNMGYPAPAHLKGIRELGLTPLHRRSFRHCQP